MSYGPKPDVNGHLIATPECCGGCGSSGGLNSSSDYQTSADPNASTARDTPLGSAASTDEAAASAN